MRLLFSDRAPRSVLEIGCGNGALYQDLGFDSIPAYLGVDFSESMLTTFKSRFPGARLSISDGATYRTDEKFDLIFSSHVVQYWDAEQLAQHVANATAQLTDRGIIVMAGIPWARMRWAFARGDVAGGQFTGSHRRSWPLTSAAYVRERLHPDIGHWYELRHVTTLAARHNRRATFRASGYYPYRFHTVLLAHSSGS